MAEGLKLVVGADVKQAERALKGLTTTAQAEGTKAGRALGSGLNKSVPAIQNIPKAAKPAIQAVSKLGDSIETLRGLMLAKQSFLITEKDITKVAILNKEIKALQSEIIRVQAIGSGGVNLGGAGAAGKKAFGALKSAANIIPGLGIASILGVGVDFISGLFTNSDKANEKIKELIVNVRDLASSAGAGTAGEAAKVNALVGVIANQTNSYEQRNNALKELQKINKNYFGDLTLEATKLELLKQRANEYTQAIIQQAVIKAFEDQIGKTAVAISEQTNEMIKAEKALQKLKDAQKAVEASKPSFGGLAAQANTDKLNKAVNAVSSANKNVLAQGSALSDLRGKYDELTQAINEAVQASLKLRTLDAPGGPGKQEEDLVAKAKRIAAFLDKNTQFDVRFEVDPLDSEADILNQAKAFIEKARKFVETGLPPFNFKPLLFAEPVFIPDPKFFRDMQLQAGIVGNRAFKEVKKSFEDSVEAAGKSNPIVIKVIADIQAAIKKENQQRSELASGLGLKIEGVNTGESALTKVQKESIAAANAINGVLNPAFQSLFSTILAGENPLKAFFQSLGDSVIQLIQKLISAAIQAAILSAIFPGGVGGVKGFGGFFKNILGFAAGGLVTGPTLGLIGEGVGTSRSNPEVVAPLDKLQGMIAGMGGAQMQPVVVTGRLRGRDISLSNSRDSRQRRRLGG
jgi:hypothetical protein